MLTSLILFALVATLSPGGVTTLATASGAQFGYLKSLTLLLGIAAALALLVAVSATGLFSAMTQFPMLSLAMKLAGSVYLFWLAVNVARAGTPGAGPSGKANPIGVFGGTLLLLAKSFLSGPTKASKRRSMNVAAAQPPPLPAPFDMSMR